VKADHAPLLAQNVNLIVHAYNPMRSALLLAPLVALVSLYSLPDQPQREIPAFVDVEPPDENPRFRAVFDTERQVSVRGEGSRVMTSSHAPLLHSGGIYVSDWSGHRFFVFSAAGQLRQVIGEEGSAAGQMRMPYGATTDERGYVYLNERGASRIHVLDPNGRPASILPHESTAEEVHAVRRRGDEATLFVVGPTRCDAPIGCAGRRIRIRAGEVIDDRPFADVGPTLPPIATWTGAPLPDGGFLVVNVTSHVIERFGPDLQATSRVALPIPERVEVRQELGGGSPVYRPYEFSGPRISRVAVLGDRLLVQWTASRLDAPTYRYVVGVYTLAGVPLLQDIPTDLQMISARDGRVTFARFVPGGPGQAEIRSYRLNLPD
jgi:hypothetical protein